MTMLALSSVREIPTHPSESVASPALLSRITLDMVISVQPVISKRWVGQFWIVISLKLLLSMSPNLMKWSGLSVPPLDPSPSQYWAPCPSITAPASPGTG